MSSGGRLQIARGANVSYQPPLVYKQELGTQPTPT
jgi:hypothetical protein